MRNTEKDGEARASHCRHAFAAHMLDMHMLHAVWRDARLRSMSPARLHVFAPLCCYSIVECGGPRAPSSIQCTPVCAFLSRRIDRRLLFPSQSSLLLRANTSHPVCSLHKTFSHPLPDLTLVIFTVRTLHIHASPSPPAKRNHSLAPTNQTLNNRQHGQGKQAFTLVHASALAAAVATAQAH